jgi:hypothetical protein
MRAYYEIVPGDVPCLGNKSCHIFSRTNQQLSCIDKSVLNVCSSCKCHDESTSHINRCHDPGRAHTLKD